MKKNVLILGGTNFIGRNLVERFLKIDDYHITLFNRQLSNSNLFPNVEKIKGDRESEDIKQIANRCWDFVIDLSCYYPASLERVIDLLENVQKYILISTCSVYDNSKNEAILKSEDANILECTDEQRIDRGLSTYGNRKAECERILIASNLNYVILRPALVFGRFDPTDRFYYWLYQVKMKKRLVVPENGMRLFSTTYVIDLVNVIVQCLDEKFKSEIFNVISNPKTSIREIIDISNEFIKSEHTIVNASAKFLRENDIKEWTGMPLWINGDFFIYSRQKLEDELSPDLLPFRTAVEETLAYYDRENWPIPQYGISEEKRCELIGKINS